MNWIRHNLGQISIGTLLWAVSAIASAILYANSLVNGKVDPVAIKVNSLEVNVEKRLASIETQIGFLVAERGARYDYGRQAVIITTSTKNGK